MDERYIDLHVHSTMSDGTFTPAQVAEYAVEKGLYAFALTDHDTTGGVEEAVKVADGRVMVIPGIEFSANYMETELHILGLNVDYKNPVFQSFIEACKNTRIERNKKMLYMMNRHRFPITENVVKSRYGELDTITRAHFAKYLVDEGYVRNKNEAFEKYLGKDGCCYVSKKPVKPEDVVKVIKNADGHPILAHPLQYGFDDEELNRLLVSLKGYGLEGLEVIYSLYSDEEQKYLSGIADKYGMYITGGSDFHGEIKPDIDLAVGKGNLKVPASLLVNIIS